MTVVLTPIDGSDRALRAVPWAAKLAGPGGSVVLLRVVPPPPAYAQSLFGLAGEDEVKQNQGAWDAVAKADTDEAARLLQGSDVAVEQLVAQGEPDEEILAAADRREAGMIAMASHGRGAIGRAIFGSVADRVARGATVPVLILRTPDDEPDDDADIARIVVPLDGSEVAAQALPVASAIARQLGAPAHVVRAVDPVASMPAASGVFGAVPLIDAELTDQIWEEAEAEAQTTVNDAVSRLQSEGVVASGATLKGSPFFAINEAAKPGDLLVLTSHGRGGVQRWLLGSVAEKLVREATAPVLLVPTQERVEESRSRGVEK